MTSKKQQLFVIRQKHMWQNTLKKTKYNYKMFKSIIYDSCLDVSMQSDLYNFTENVQYLPIHE
jgi:hypothetical protein